MHSQVFTTLRLYVCVWASWRPAKLLVVASRTPELSHTFFNKLTWSPQTQEVHPRSRQTPRQTLQKEENKTVIFNYPSATESEKQDVLCAGGQRVLQAAYLSHYSLFLRHIWKIPLANKKGDLSDFQWLYLQKRKQTWETTNEILSAKQATVHFCFSTLDAWVRTVKQRVGKMFRGEDSTFFWVKWYLKKKHIEKDFS